MYYEEINTRVLPMSISIDKNFVNTVVLGGFKNIKGTIEIILSKAPDHNYVLAVYLYNELGRIRINFQGTLFVFKVDNFSLGEGTEMRSDFIIPIGRGRGGIVIPADKLNSNKLEFKLTYFRRYKNRYNKYAVLGKNENPATSDLDGLMWFKWISSNGLVK